MPGAQCHAVRVPVTGADVRLLRDRLAAAGPWRLWTDDVPAAPAEPLAVRRREAELRRPVEREVRCVLLRYGDGTADLVLVAHRDRLDGAGLRHLAEVLTGERPPSPCPEPAASRTGFPPPADAPDWGDGDPTATTHGTCALDLPFPHGSPSLPALALTLARYDGHGGTGSATVASDRTGTLRYELPEPATLDQLAAGGGERVTGTVLAGVLDDPDAPPADRLPCLAPPFPLTFVFSPLPSGGTRLTCYFRLSHVSAAVAEGFTRHYGEVCRQWALAPKTAVADVELLDADERARVARLGRPAVALASEPDTLPWAFARIAAARPDAVALCDGATELTYRELDERSARVAAGLLAHGVRPGDRVGVCLERTAELVVTLLGVVRAGAAYVPTDPAYPADRLAHTVADAGLRVVVTRLPEFPSGDGITLATPDDLAATAVAAAAPELPEPAPGDPAYVIYTSGSTGRPKGVLVPHRNVTALIDATRDEYRLGPDDTWTLFHSAAFDFSVWEIWGCLLTGGRLVVVPYFVSREPEDFRDLLLERRVTVLSQTPSAFSQLLRTDHAALPVRLVVFGGEPLDSRMLLPWFDRHPEHSCRMVNMFGITETTVHVTAQTVTRALALAGSRSVGPALPGWHLYVTDERGRLVPPGVTGEIRVGGAGVATGYLNRPELTAERFHPDPHAPDPHAPDPLAPDPHPLGPAAPGPAALGPAALGPAALDPAVLGLAALGLAVPDPAVPDLAVTDPAVPGPAALDPAVPDPAVSGAAALDPAVLGPAALDPAVLGPAALGLAVPRPAVPRPAVSGPADADPAAPDPHSSGTRAYRSDARVYRSDARVYRSGDLGRLRPDGRLEHLGRIDSQVKIRGFRIELDEIRSVLLEDPAVAAAAVVVRRDDPADPATARLDAYVVPTGGAAAADPQGVRKRAAGILPEHMVPATVTPLDALPLTTNGKLDADRLPAPLRSTPTAAAAPRTPGPLRDAGLAEALEEIWESVLGTPVGLDDDFFELGGNSLFAVRINAALRARGLASVPLRDLYRTPTIRALTG
ncbi:amino acid adenylation domain-containing protein [Streptomyces sp. T028]|uniref:amino acid adenylation domain-containing protein n=1 Tax=Streptomyces sp. T028 TaxID=3394379 RepID=UPI003A8503FA